jgi:hypothetical protein
MKKTVSILILIAAIVSCSKENPSGGGGKAPDTVMAVDLGLSVKWASCNVGASSPEGYGNYFSWGETVTKNTFSLYNYKWLDFSSGSGYMMKYNNRSAYGKVDNKSTLDPEDDAAQANWGGKWRMPTLSEWAELVTHCSWTLDEYGGTIGATVTGPNGNSIFLPAAGNNTGTLAGINSYGEYWTSMCDQEHQYPTFAYAAYFDSSDIRVGSNGRAIGASVRPVCK